MALDDEQMSLLRHKLGYLFFDNQDPCDGVLDLESVNAFPWGDQRTLLSVTQCTSIKSTVLPRNHSDAGRPLGRGGSLGNFHRSILSRWHAVETC